MCGGQLAFGDCGVGADVGLAVFARQAQLQNQALANKLLLQCPTHRITALPHATSPRPPTDVGRRCFVLVVVSLLSPDFEITWNEIHSQVHDNFLSGIRIQYLSIVIGSIQFRQVVSKIRPIRIASLSDASFGRRCRVASQEHISGRSSSPIWFPPIRFLPACVVSTIGLPGLAPTHNLQPPD